MLPVIIEATGTISESFRTYLSIIPGKEENKEPHKTAILDNANMPRKVLSKIKNSFIMEGNITCAIIVTAK